MSQPDCLSCLATRLGFRRCSHVNLPPPLSVTVSAPAPLSRTDATSSRRIDFTVPESTMNTDLSVITTPEFLAFAIACITTNGATITGMNSNQKKRSANPPATKTAEVRAAFASHPISRMILSPVTRRGRTGLDQGSLSEWESKSPSDSLLLDTGPTGARPRCSLREPWQPPSPAHC